MSDGTAHAERAPGTAASGAPAPSRRAEVLWCAAAAALTAALAIAPLIGSRRFYFVDDTQASAFGFWYHIGQMLRAGHLDLVDVHAGQGGNFLVEGQLGLWNPVMLAISWGASLASDAAGYVAAVKIAALVVASIGVFLLVRSYGAPPAAGALAAVLVPLGGFTVYVDAPSWVTGLFTWALLPYFWWGLRRFALRRAGSPLVPCVFGFLLVTVGYVHGTIALVFVGLVTMVDVWIEHGWRRVGRVLGVAAVMAGVAVTIYLPAVLSARETVRASTGILNDGFLVADLSGLVAGVNPISQPQVSGWWGATASDPLLYSAWALPLFAFVDWRRARSALRALTGTLIFLLLGVLFIIGPSYAGPLRTPVRFAPYVVLALVVILAVLLGSVPARDALGRRSAGALAAVAATTYAGFAQVPSSWRHLAVAAALGAVGVIAVGWLVARGSAGRRVVVAAVVVVVVTGGVTAIQRDQFRAAPLADWGEKTSVESYRAIGTQMVGDGVVVGEPTSLNDWAVWDETALSTLWYLTGRDVQNMYSATGFAGYNSALCVNNRGEMCGQALDALFATVRGKGASLADLMSIDSVQLILPATAGTAVTAAPPGWSEVARTALTATWTRDDLTEPAGGATWVTPGGTVRGLSSNESTTEVSVVAAPVDTTVVFSRLAFPGYAVSGCAGARMAEPTAGFLLSVTVPAGVTCGALSVHFAPPGWRLEQATLLLAILGMLGWAAVATVSRRRSRHAAAEPAAR